jgi:hypothetical protein
MFDGPNHWAAMGAEARNKSVPPFPFCSDLASILISSLEPCCRARLRSRGPWPWTPTFCFSLSTRELESRQMTATTLAGCMGSKSRRFCWRIRVRVCEN